MRGRSRSQRMRSVQRDSSTIANGDLLRQFNLVEDMRVYHPEGDDRPALDLGGHPVRFSVSSVVGPPRVSVHRRPFLARSYYTNSIRGVQLPVGVKFQGPLRVITCLRRKIRKQVLFALGRTKSGRGGSRRRSWRSDVGC